MGMQDKIENATTTSWLTDGLSRAEINCTKHLGRIATAIEVKRHSLNMSQEDFANHLDVSVDTVKEWESGEHDFTISQIDELFEKLGLRFGFTITPQSNKVHVLTPDELENIATYAQSDSL